MDISRRSVLAGLAAAAIPPALAACAPTERLGEPVAAERPRELVVGAGAWCWFQAPRAAFDRHGLLWLGSTQGRSGPTPGEVGVTGVDLASLTVTARHRLAVDRADDHTSPSVLPVGDDVQVGWAPHRLVDWLELGGLGAGLQRVHRPTSIEAPGRGMAYVSAHIVGDERWVLYRGEQFSWNLLTSPDGSSWRAEGLVVAPSSPKQRPYLLAASSGDRLHVLVTDGNPTEFRGTSARAGTIELDRTVRGSEGAHIGTVGDQAPVPAAFTTVAAGRPGSIELTDTDVWLSDLRVIAGAPCALLSVRDPWPTGERGPGGWRHEVRWARHDGSAWQVEHAAWGGSELYRRQPDYSGLATLDPSDAGRIVVSSDVDPATGAPLRSTADGRVHWELHEGRRHDDGWRWRPLTTDSTEDHLRPVLAASGDRRALAWMRGTYHSWMSFDTQLVVRPA